MSRFSYVFAMCNVWKMSADTLCLFNKHWPFSLSFFWPFSFFKILFNFRGERRKKKERNINCFSQGPSWGAGLQARHMPWPEIELVSFWFAGQSSVHWATPTRAIFLSFSFLFFFFLKRFYLFLDRGEGKEKEKERNINVWLPLTLPLPGTWPATQACFLTGNWTSDPLVHRPSLSPLSHTSQGHFPFL